MTKVSTKQRMISASDLQSAEYLRTPDEAKGTAFGLWLFTNVDGRRELLPELIAGDLYPGRAATQMVEEHLLMLDESGFLTIYEAEGSHWIQLKRPLKADRRGAISDCPPPPDRGATRMSMAVGGARERAEARVREQVGERTGEWAAWERAHEHSAPPPLPLLLQAPPIGCPEHPDGRFADCGPCGTARRRHDKWVAQERHTRRMAEFEQGQDDDEPW